MIGRMTSVLSLLIAFIVTVLVFFLVSYLGIKFGINIPDVKSFWPIWIIVRLVFYAVATLFLYRLTQLNQQEHRKLIRTCIIGVVVLEAINIMQLIS